MSLEVNRELLKKARLGAMDGDKGVRALVSEIVKLQGPSGLDYCEKPADRTALYEAVWTDQVAVYRLLLEKGASPNKSDSVNVSPLHLAARFGHIAAAELLIDKGADINAKDSQGQTPLHYAAAHNRRQVAVLLVARGALVNVIDNDKVTCAHLAAFNGERSFADYLVANGAHRNRLGINNKPVESLTET